MENNPYPRNNQQAMLSLIFGLATILTFCTGMVPLPFTGLLCFPLSFIFGLLALVYGLVALNQIRAGSEGGSPLAWTGIIIGGMVFLCVLCMVITLASFFVVSPESIPTPPFFDNYQL